MVKHKMRWEATYLRRNVYLFDKAALEPQVYPAFIQTLYERGNIVRMEPKDIKSGLLFGKRRSSLWCKFERFEAWFTAAATGPNCAIGYHIFPLKEEISEIEKQDMEALGHYMAKALSITLAKIGMEVEDSGEVEGGGGDEGA